MKKGNERPVRTGPRDGQLAEDACPTCGAGMRPRRARLVAHVNGQEVRVSGVPHLACSKCGEILVRAENARHLQEAGIESYRRKNGLLSADEIRALRAQYGLKQAELATILRLGDNTVSRWEAGRNVQTGAMDLLLRLIRDLPGCLEYLRRVSA